MSDTAVPRTTTTTQMFRVTINAPIKQVWRQLTQSDVVLPFFFGSVLHTTRLAPGAPIRMRSPDGKYTGVVGEVLEFNPPYRYAHTFKFTNLDDPICKVTYELKEVGGGTELTLTSEEVPVGTKTEKYMGQGGEIIVQTLKAMLETGKPPFKARMIMFMNGLTAFLTPRKCLSVHWPLDKRIE
ncbi:MAG: SRPBCC domain-containing protein [Pirellulaceae bacterium]|nr:SRPBCC domain-containing protein [Pirellulaceae bacterium]